jgi:hypothetical protein
MITLNRNTKKAQAFLTDREWAKNNGNFSIYSIYERPSSTKINIAQDIEKRLTSVVYHNGNSFCFTCSGIDKDGNLVILTKSSEYKILL